MANTSEGNGTLRSRAEARLRAAILDGRFRAGERLIEQQLCDFLGVSRSVLRECLAQLEARGLVESAPFRGFRVVDLGVHKICEIFELRTILEVSAVELFAERANAQEIEALRAAMTAIAESYETADPAAMIAGKDHYFQLIITGTRNAELARALELVRDRIDLLRGRLLSRKRRRKHSLVEMEALTEALIQRDRIAARTATLNHLTRARAELLAMIEAQRTGSEEEPADAGPVDPEQQAGRAAPGRWPSRQVNA